MKRSAFLKELKTSLFDTVKYVYEPFLEDDIKKIKKSTDRLLNIEWIHIAKNAAELMDYQQMMILKKPFFFVRVNGKMRAFSGICPTCSNLLNVSSMQKTCKCLMCEKTVHFHKNEEEDEWFLSEHSLKEEEDGIYIGIKRT
ncbi:MULTISPECIES: hypothetical protein [Bacillus]|uniref:hypothetical protein n=1 Tax=Bacillus TaxID=1386 RepID=UPI00031F9E3B|nr:MULTISPECIES: hypothetical protein [Bacillus]